MFRKMMAGLLAFTLIGAGLPVGAGAYPYDDEIQDSAQIIADGLSEQTLRQVQSMDQSWLNFEIAVQEGQEANAALIAMPAALSPDPAPEPSPDPEPDPGVDLQTVDLQTSVQQGVVLQEWVDFQSAIQQTEQTAVTTDAQVMFSVDPAKTAEADAALLAETVRQIDLAREAELNGILDELIKLYGKQVAFCQRDRGPNGVVTEAEKYYLAKVAELNQLKTLTGQQRMRTDQAIVNKRMFPLEKYTYASQLATAESGIPGLKKLKDDTFALFTQGGVTERQWVDVQIRYFEYLYELTFLKAFSLLNEVVK